MPTRVDLCEVGPRDGFQFESLPIPTELKIDVLRGLVSAGLRTIQVTSFVHPGKVPQMADAEAVFEAVMAFARPGVRFTGLCLNQRGVDRAAAAGLSYVDLSIATNDTHGRDNAGMSAERGAELAADMIARAREAGMQVQLGLQTVFGYREPGDTDLGTVVAWAGRFAEMGVESISIADSTGMANPGSITERVLAVQDAIGDVPLVLHLHDTRGLGLVNVFQAMQLGVTRFDTSLGGLGGCPFIPGATGNIATEDVLQLCSSLGVETGVEAAAVAEQTRLVADHLGRSLPGRMYKLL